MLEDLLVNPEEESGSEGECNSDFTLEDLLINLREDSESEGECNSAFTLEGDILPEGGGKVELSVAASTFACMVKLVII
jgi:hypothetical protein